MKSCTPILTAFMLWFYSLTVSAQSVQSLQDIKPNKEYDNILSQQIAGDSLSTSFVIWIKKEVKPHRHAKHSENILILEGEGIILLSGNSLTVKKGDYVFVPCNTVHSLKVTSSVPVKVLSIQSPEFKGDDRIASE